MKYLSRRKFLKLISCTVVILLFSQQLFGSEKEVSVKTYTYKKVGDLEIKADVYRLNDNTIRPVAVWIHGGALINGHREEIDNIVNQKLLEAGYAIVSVDYRLAPETKLPSIIEDIEDVFEWIYKKGPDLFQVDTSKIAVVGGSAGGYLALLSGFRIKPRPTVLVAFYGYGDLIGDWFSKPSMHHFNDMTKQKAWEQVNGSQISDSRDRKGDGRGFYRYSRKHGIWPKVVSGWDSFTEAENFFEYMPLKNITPDFPPTILIHGTNDTDVPYEQSLMMVKEFEKHNVEHKLITIPDAEHGLKDGDPELINAAYNSAFEFIKQFMEN